MNERHCLFQRDGTKPHTFRTTMEFLRQFFDNRLISKGLWPPRSFDPTSLDFFLWGTLKNNVFQIPPSNLKKLKERIKKEIGNITEQTFQKVFQNLLRSALTCKSQFRIHFQYLL
ncbi:hypothetical protein PGB90_003406 [Kerria lacca]